MKKTSLTNLNVIYLLINGKCSKISNTFLSLFSNKLLVVRAEIHKKNLIWVCTVCLNFFGRQLAFET